MIKPILGIIGLILFFQSFAAETLKMTPADIIKKNETYISLNSEPLPYLPKADNYNREHNCYVTCYSKDGNSIIGFINVSGKYSGKICQPDGYQDNDVSKVYQFIRLCAIKFDDCKNDVCHVDGNTSAAYERY